MIQRARDAWSEGEEDEDIDMSINEYNYEIEEILLNENYVEHEN